MNFLTTSCESCGLWISWIDWWDIPLQSEQSFGLVWLVQQDSPMSRHFNCTQEFLWVILVMLMILAGWIQEETWSTNFFESISTRSDLCDGDLTTSVVFFNQIFLDGSKQVLSLKHLLHPFEVKELLSLNFDNSEPPFSYGLINFIW